MSGWAAKFRMVGYASLAAGIACELLGGEKHPVEAALGKTGSRKGLGKGPASRALPAAPGGKAPPMGKPTVQFRDVGPIEERVALIQKLIKKGSMNPLLRERTVQILSQKCGDRWCVPEKDCLAEVKWIFNALRNPASQYAVRYTRDMLFADTFTAAERTLVKMHGGDCDDYTITIGAMLCAVGHVVKIRVIATNEASNPGGNWSHVYLITPVEFDDPDAKWMAIDCSVEKPVGWEAPGAKEVAATGRPAGIVLKVKDFPVV